MRVTLLAFILFSFTYSVNACPGNDTIYLADSGQQCSIRGLSIARNGAIWISGSKGHIARSVDTGKTWAWQIVKGFEQTDFRDIHAIDANTAIIMGIGTPANILKTVDGGQHWKVVYHKETAGIFLDAMDFRDAENGLCIGDPMPVNGDTLHKRFFLIRTKDGGETWQEEQAAKAPMAGPGEAVFSASGTNIAWLDNKAYEYAFISGGIGSHLHLIGRHHQPNKKVPLVLNQSKESAGTFSLATDGKNAFYCVGGDYKLPDAQLNNFAWTADIKRPWHNQAVTPPSGYRSCIRILEGSKMIVCGPNGVDMCNAPDQWFSVSKQGFNVCMVWRDQRMVFFGGAGGRIGIMRY